MPALFDVFLSHNNQDTASVEKIAALLRSAGLKVWLAKWETQPGFPWQKGLEEAIQKSRAVAVFVGKAGLGPWQELEVRAFVARSTQEEVPVIPVLLPGCPDSPQLTLFLQGLSWVDLRDGLTEAGLARLIWGINGAKDEGHPSSALRAPRRRWRLAVGLLIVVLALAAGFWLLPPAKPQMYSVRVQVLDPQGRPVVGSTVHASAGNEPHLLPDGWWEVQIPTAKVPASGHISLWAGHGDWEENKIDLRLGTDPNRQVEIRLKPPESWLRGRVVDGKDRALQGVRVTRQDGAPGEAITDADGRFALKLALPRDRPIELRSEYKDWKPGDDHFFTGRNGCTIILEKE